SPFVAREQSGERDRRFARRTRQQDSFSAQGPRLGEKVVEEKRRHKERTKEREPVLFRSLVKRVGSGEAVFVVRKRQRCTVSACLDESCGGRVAGAKQRPARHRKVSVEALAFSDCLVP